jgi:integrase
MPKQQIRNGARVGGLMVSVWCKPPIGRIYRSTGLLPSDRNARAIAEEITEMLRALNRLGDVATLRKIKDGPHRGGVSLMEALHAYRINAHHLLTGGANLNLLTELQQYIEGGPQAAATRKRFTSTVRALQSHGLLQEKHTVGDLPEVVRRMQRFYESRKSPDMFNNSRQFLLGFVVKHLLMKRSDRLYAAIRETSALKVAARREHHPFLSPQDMLEFVDEVMQRDDISPERRNLYAEAIITCCLTGMRPEEYCGQMFRHDGKADFGTGHLLIAGTKTPQSHRVVPKVAYPTLLRLHGLHVATLNRILSRVGNGKVRMRDFRRTYAIWCEKASIPASHIARYMGHKQRGQFEQTAHYQRHKPNTPELNADQALLDQWLTGQLSAAKAKDSAKWASSSMSTLAKWYAIIDNAKSQDK